MAPVEKPLHRMMVATSIIGGASVVAILIGLVRTKALALLVGPEGLGLMGLFVTIMGTGSAIFGMGIAFGGVRQIAEHESSRAVARRALWLATWPLAASVALVMWLGRHDIARLATGNLDHALDIGLTGIGAALAIVAATQLAVIQGLRQVGNLARARIYGALLSLVVGVLAAAFLGRLGIVAAVIAVPLVQVLVGLFYAPSREASPAPVPASDVKRQWRHLFSVGIAVMVSSTLGALVMVWIRARIVQGFGLDAAGFYQAAYAISAMNVGIVLSAMAADYLPRLSSIKDDRGETNVLVNQQLHVALLVGTPLICLLVALAPLVLNILYSGAFSAAADVLRWQATGEILRLPGWALSFLLVARRDNKAFFCLEILFVIAYIAATYLLLPVMNIAGAGLAYLFAYAAYSIVLLAVCRRRHAISITRGNLVQLFAAIGVLLTIIALAAWSPWAAGVFGSVCAALFAAFAARELARSTDIGARFRRSAPAETLPAESLLPPPAA